jgi:hypothetical protein
MKSFFYQCYLLRFWREDNARSSGLRPGLIWRFSLEDTRTGRRYGFADLAAMTTFLQDELRARSDTSTSQNDR